MSEQFRNKPSAASPQSEPDVVFLLKKIQEQLTFLERKVDTLINQPQERSFNREKPFAKPFRPFSPSTRYSKGPREYSPRERDTVPGRPFDKRQAEDKRGFSPKNKPFFQKRKERG